MKKIISLQLAALLASLMLTQPARSQPLDSLVRRAITFSGEQLAKTATMYGDSLFPRSTMENGDWKTVKPNDWTSGFFPGLLWYAYELTGNASFMERARLWTARLEEQKLNTRTHDVGFIMFCSYGNGIRLAPEGGDKEALLMAAQSLSTRYSEKVGAIRSWDSRKWPFPVIVDNMMNLELLFWASKNGGGKALHDVAVTHASTTLRDHFRKDASTYHVVSYDSTNGSIVDKETHQGYAHESVWARGQAWAIYGFTMAYRESGDRKFLKIAERAALWFLRHLPADKVPYWDFNAPNIPHEPRDASAAAIVASALFELGTLTENKSFKREFLNGAKEILAVLCKPPYLAVGTRSMGILNHATGNWPSQTEIDVSLIYGDYYFLEAIKRYQALVKSRAFDGKR